MQQQQSIHPTTQVQEKIVVEETVKIEESIDVQRYENVLATEIITEPGQAGDAYFVDMNTISQVQGGKIYFLSLNSQEMQNPNLNYVLPIGLNNPNVKNCSLLIKNVQEFFLIDEDQEVDYFVNIAEMDNMIKKNFVQEMINKVDIISLICTKQDLTLIEDNIDKIKAIKIVDITSEYDMQEVKTKILSLEKRKLMEK